MFDNNYLVSFMETPGYMAVLWNNDIRISKIIHLASITEVNIGTTLNMENIQ